MNDTYNENGFIHVRSLFKEEMLEEIRGILEDFHDTWLSNNQALYENNVLNSAGLTGSDYLNFESRLRLFNFISHPKILKLIESVIPINPCFVNTQLFFNPKKVSQKNYWHRDTQYHLSLAEQENILRGPKMLHIRIPMQNEEGIEVVPGTHLRWDNQEELDVRLEQHGRSNHDNLENTNTIKLDVGDALLFSANMIHRGLYGMNRLALDILVCDPDISLLEFAQEANLPSDAMKQKMLDSTLFDHTEIIKKTSHSQKIVS